MSDLVRGWDGVSIWFEMPIGFRCTGLNIAMAKGNPNNPQRQTTFGGHQLDISKVLLVFGFVLCGCFFCLFVCFFEYWVGQKVCWGFSIRCDGKTQMNFLANLVIPV